MKKTLLWAGLFALGSLLTSTSALADEFRLSSPSLIEGGMLGKNQVFQGFGCQGDNISPALTWENPPIGTKSFAITMYDPDAPSGSGWWHWVVYNLPANIRHLAPNAGEVSGKNLPTGSQQARTDFGTRGYGGACPPVGHGMHRYQWIVHALDVAQLPVSNDASPALIGFMLGQHRLGRAQLTSVYTR